jgi:hypothetical protein
LSELSSFINTYVKIRVSDRASWWMEKSVPAMEREIAVPPGSDPGCPLANAARGNGLAARLAYASSDAATKAVGEFM